MKITLSETDLKDAIQKYISRMGVDLSDKRVEVTMTAGRGTNGHTANLEILPLDLISNDDAREDTDAETPTADDSDENGEDQQAIPFDWKASE